jgi:hypothetical protein
MMRRFVLLALLLLPPAAAAQQVGPVVTPAATFESWTPAQPAGYAARGPVLDVALESRDRTGNALLGGVIGAAAGVAFCTVVSNIVKDEGTGFSTCTTKGYLLTGGVGFALGFLVGLTV